MGYFELLFIFLSCFLIRPTTVALHELGHGIPALLITKQKVSLYIGSYGDSKKSLRVKLGLLHFYFTYNIFAWNKGLCVPSAKKISLNNQIIYILGGPIISLTTVIGALYLAFTYDINGMHKLLLIFLLISALIDFVYSLVPSSTPYKAANGNLLYNDGENLRRLFYLKKLPTEFSDATESYHAQKFEDAAILYEKLLADGFTKEVIYRSTIIAFLHAKNYRKAKEVSDEFAQRHTLNSDDFSAMALAYSQIGLHEQALEYYDRSLILNPKNIYALNNKGYTLNLMESYEEATSFFNEAIAIDDDFAYAYCNRGLSKIKMGQFDEGLKDIYYSLEVDKENSYAYRNLGIYYLEQEKFSEALNNFKKQKNSTKIHI